MPRISSQQQTSIISPNGVLDFNTSFDDFKEGNLSYSINTRVQNSEYDSLWERWTVPGTLLAYSTTDPVQQNKKFRFYFDSATDDEDYVFTFYTPNARHLGNINSFGLVPAMTIANILTNFSTNTPILFAIYGETVSITNSTITSATQGYIDLEITTVGMWDYYHDLIDTGYLYDIQVIQEAYSADMVGVMTPFAARDMLGDLFQLWTTKFQIANSISMLTEQITVLGCGL